METNHKQIRYVWNVRHVSGCKKRGGKGRPKQETQTTKRNENKETKAKKNSTKNLPLEEDSTTIGHFYTTTTAEVIGPGTAPLYGIVG